MNSITTSAAGKVTRITSYNVCYTKLLRVSAVGIYDMLRVELSPNGAFNVTEFGTVEDSDQFRALYAYSPYHHVRDDAQRTGLRITSYNVCYTKLLRASAEFCVASFRKRNRGTTAERTRVKPASSSNWNISPSRRAPPIQLAQSFGSLTMDCDSCLALTMSVMDIRPPGFRTRNISSRITSYNVCYTKLLRKTVLHRLRREDHGRGAGGVVVGAVVDGVFIRPHRTVAAVSQVIVVGADHDVLPGQRAPSGA